MRDKPMPVLTNLKCRLMSQVSFKCFYSVVPFILQLQHILMGTRNSNEERGVNSCYLYFLCPHYLSPMPELWYCPWKYMLPAATITFEEWSLPFVPFLRFEQFKRAHGISIIVQKSMIHNMENNNYSHDFQYCILSITNMQKIGQ